MNSNNPKLRIYRPTPTTVSFTVSTRHVPRTFSAHALLYLSSTLRICSGLLILVLLRTKWGLTFPPEHGGARTGWNLEHAVGPRGSRPVDQALEKLGWLYLCPTAACALWLVARRGYSEESLLVLRGLGVQTSSSSATYLTTPTTRFIPTTSIQDIFIHEAFKGFEVRYYLAIVVNEEEDVVVVFPDLLPRRHILEEVWRGTRACLYEPKT